MNIPQMLYDSEINFSIETFWDCGFDVRLGDKINGWKDKGYYRDWDSAMVALTAMAVKHYPDSTFTKNMRAL